MEVKVPKLSVARASRKVAMPRFRRGSKKPMSLTEAVRRILMRAAVNPQPFAVFAIDGRLVVTDTTKDRFKTLKRRSPDDFIGTYAAGIKVADLLDDLCGRFSDIGEVIE